VAPICDLMSSTKKCTDFGILGNGGSEFVFRGALIGDLAWRPPWLWRSPDENTALKVQL
jgi:hypothetical protein